MNEPSLPKLEFRSVRDAAAALRTAATDAGVDALHLLPFNRYDPADTYWWLSPTPDNPAYKHGKIALTGGDPARPGDLFVGLNIEKGIGETAASMFSDTPRGRRWLMDDTWMWRRRLVPALLSDEFPAAAAVAAETAGVPLTVVIDAAYAEPPRGWDDQDAFRPDTAFDLVRFEVAPSGLTLIDANTPVGVLAPVAEVRDFFGIAASIDSIAKADWLWADFHIGVRLLSANGQPDWSAADVWRRVCAPWAPWLS